MSPVSTGMKIVNLNSILHFEYLSEFPVFNNDSKIQDLNCYIFLIHGLRDQIVPHTFSLRLAKNSSHKTAWYPEKSGHYDVISTKREKFYRKCKEFIEQLIYVKDPLNNFSNSNICNQGNNSIKVNSFRMNDNYVRSTNSMSNAIKSKKNEGSNNNSDSKKIDEREGESVHIKIKSQPSLQSFSWENEQKKDTRSHSSGKVTNNNFQNNPPEVNRSLVSIRFSENYPDYRCSLENSNLELCEQQFKLIRDDC